MRTRRHLWFLLLPSIVLAAMAALVSVSGAQPLGAIAVTELIPANGSTITAGEVVTLSAFIESDSSIDTNNVKVLLDESPLDVQLVVGSGAVRVGFTTTSSFAAGNHTLGVFAINTDGEAVDVETTFTAIGEPAVTSTVVAGVSVTADEDATTTAIGEPAVTSTVVAGVSVTADEDTTTAAPTAEEVVATEPPVVSTVVAGVATTADEDVTTVTTAVAAVATEPAVTTTAVAGVATIASGATLPAAGGIPTEVIIAILMLGAATTGVGIQLRRQ